jgi:hypothetical protein
MQGLDGFLRGLLRSETCPLVPLRCARIARLLEVALGLSKPISRSIRN